MKHTIWLADNMQIVQDADRFCGEIEPLDLSVPKLVITKVSSEFAVKDTVIKTSSKGSKGSRMTKARKTASVSKSSDLTR